MSSPQGSRGIKCLVEELGQSLFAIISGKPLGFSSVKARLPNRRPTIEGYRIFLEEDGLDVRTIAVSLEKQIVAIRCSRQFAATIWPALADRCRKKLKIVRNSASTKSPNVAEGSLVAMRGSTTWCIGGFTDQWDCQSAGREIVNEAKMKVRAGNRDFYVSRPSVVFDDSEKQQRLNRLFPSVKDRSKLQIDEEAAYSVSNEDSAATVAQMAKRIASKREAIAANVVIDATACVGGNTLAFARVFERVVAIEIDAKRVEYLKGNIQHIREEEARKSWVQKKISADIRVIHGDCLRVLPGLLRDLRAEHVVVFADPPWGGRYYPVHSRNDDASSVCKGSTDDVHLKGGGGLEDLVLACSHYVCVSILLLKVPSSFDHQALVGALPCINRHDVHDWDLMKLLVLHFSRQLGESQLPPPINVKKRRRPTGTDRKRRTQRQGAPSAQEASVKKKRRRECRSEKKLLTADKVNALEPTAESLSVSSQQKKRPSHEGNRCCVSEPSLLDAADASSPVSGRIRGKEKRRGNENIGSTTMGMFEVGGMQTQLRKVHDGPPKIQMKKRKIKQGRSTILAAGADANECAKGSKPTAIVETATRLWGHFDDDWHKCVLLKTKRNGKHKVRWSDGTMNILDHDCIRPRVKKAQIAGNGAL